MTLSQKLRDGKTAIGTWNLLADPCALEIMCRAGFDYVIHDMEHGAHSLAEVKNMARAVEACGKTFLLRPPGMDTGLIQRALDAGCHGLMVPNVHTVEDVAALVACSLYPPEGNRGLSPYTRAMGYNGENVPEKMAAWNRDCFLGILIESKTGIAALPEIVRLYGRFLDVVYIGLYDLAKSLGSTDNLMSDIMQDAIREAVAILKKGGVTAGILVNSPEMIAFAKASGIRFMAYRNDTAVLYDAVTRICETFHSVQVKTEK